MKQAVNISKINILLLRIIIRTRILNIILSILAENVAGFKFNEREKYFVEASNEKSCIMMKIYDLY